MISNALHLDWTCFHSFSFLIFEPGPADLLAHVFGPPLGPVPKQRRKSSGRGRRLSKRPASRRARAYLARAPTSVGPCPAELRSSLRRPSGGSEAPESNNTRILFFPGSSVQAVQVSMSSRPKAFSETKVLQHDSIVDLGLSLLAYHDYTYAWHI